MQFINVALVVLIVNFDIYNSNEEVYEFFGMSILNGDFKDFTADWYRQVGATICITMTIFIFSPHFEFLGRFLLSTCLRSLDRGCGPIRKKKD